MRKFYQPILFSCFLFFTCPSIGQVKQDAEDVLKDTAECKIDLKEISSDGRWISYVLHYESGKEILILQNTISKAKLEFPDGSDAKFSGGRYFAYKNEMGLCVYELQSGKSYFIPEINRFSFLSNGTYLATLSDKKVLEVRKNSGVPLERIAGVMTYEVNEQNDGLLFTYSDNGKNYVAVFKAGKSNCEILSSNEQPYTQLLWRQDGKAVCYKYGGSLEYYNLENNTKYFLPSERLLEIGKIISNNPIFPIGLSDDGKKVFFGLTLAEKRKVVNGPEIWSSYDTKLYPAEMATAASGIPVVGVWFPDTGNFKIISDESRYSVRLTSTGDYALLSDPFRYGTEPDYPEKVDYYIKNVNTGAERLLLEKQSHDTTRLYTSPISNLILYYRDEKWWLYTPETDAIICVTSDVKTDWDNQSKKDSPTVVSPYGVAGWTTTEDFVLIYDKYDIWKVALNGKSAVRITHGRENTTVYRLDDSETASFKFKPYAKERRTLINLKGKLLLRTENQETWSTGYAFLSSGKQLTDIDCGPQYRTGLMKASNNSVVFLTETYTQAPHVQYKSPGSETTTLYSVPSPDQATRSVKMIQYSTSNGSKLKAALYFPDNYGQGKLYPMIVKVYEKKSNRIHRYYNSEALSDEGIALRHLTAAGYFVLYPDFELTLGDPGKSATECVVAAVKSAVSTASINPKKIGIIGHSFGGYEVNYIVTQTDIFAAAISGAGISSPISRYFGLAFSLHQTDMYRYENQQWRMGSSFFQNKDAYLNNSPIMHAEKIKTPLMLWHGKLDDVIPFDQCVSFYLALRRLGLPALMVAYPDENHSLAKHENQLDLTNRILQWFGYFLKDQTAVAWISIGLHKE